MKEIWKDVLGYEKIYEVSNKGRVRSAKGKTTHSELHGTRVWKPRVLKQKISKDNACRVSLWKNKQCETCLVHRLVAFAFIPKQEGKDYINHIDGNRLNNNVENLEWCNHLENNRHAFENGLMPNNNFVVLEDLRTGELHRFTSYKKAGEFVGRSGNFISDSIKRKDYVIDYYILYTTKAPNIVRAEFISE